MRASTLALWARYEALTADLQRMREHPLRRAAERDIPAVRAELAKRGEFNRVYIAHSYGAA